MKRLHGRSETRRIMAEGKRARVPGARLYYLSGSGPLCAAVITPVRVGSAVLRSAMRRRSREALRNAEKNDALRGSIVLVVLDAGRTQGVCEMAGAIGRACKNFLNSGNRR